MTTNEVITLCVSGLSFLGAVAAVVLAYRAYDLNRFQLRLATRNQFQQLLLGLERELVRDPTLWGVYDGHRMVPPEPIDPCHQSRLEAFVYMTLDTFQIVHAYTVDSGEDLPGDAGIFEAWRGTMRYFRDHSRLMREILARPETKQVYDARFLGFIQGL